MGPRSSERGKEVFENVRGVDRASFNGAALKRARKVVPPSVTVTSAGVASMGPRSSERGKEVDRVWCAHSAHGFNGAALKRARKETGA